MGDLPSMPRGSGIRRTVQLQFGGLDRSPSAADGTLWDTKNLTTDRLPLLTVREKRKKYALDIETKVMTVVNGERMTVDRSGTVRIRGCTVGRLPIKNNPDTWQLVRFGRSLLLPQQKILIHTEYGATEHFTTLEALKSFFDTPTEGDAGLVGELNHIGEPCKVKVYVYTGGQWTDCGYYFETKELGVTAAVSFADGTYQDAPAKGNTLRLPVSATQNLMFPLKAGDAIRISGSEIAENNKTVIIRAVDGAYGNILTFYPNTFQLPTYPAKNGPLAAYKENTQAKIVYAAYFGDDVRTFELEEAVKDTDVLVQESGTALKHYRDGALLTTLTTSDYTAGTSAAYDTFLHLTDSFTVSRFTELIGISRGMPELENCFADENRLWGTQGSRIYASKLGDPFNFDTFEGLSTDSYFLEVQTPGNFTAGCSAYGYPTFFKADYIYRMYGAQPDAYQLQELAANGVKRGCENSVAMVGNTLMYLSELGVMGYTGGYPSKCDRALGDAVLSEAAAGTDGRKYFLCARENGGARVLYVFDTENGTWIREQEINLIAFDASEGILLGQERKSLQHADVAWVFAGEPSWTGGVQETELEAIAEFGDFDMSIIDRQNANRTTIMNRKSVHRIQLRLIVGTGASVTVAIRYDSEAQWRTVKTISATMKQSVYLPILPRRCDHFRLKITGTGDWKLYALGLDLRRGSEQF